MKFANQSNRDIVLFFVIMAFISCILSLLLNIYAYFMDLVLSNSSPFHFFSDNWFEIYTPVLINWGSSFLQNLSAGFIAAILTFILVNLIFERREKSYEYQENERRDKERFVRQMANPDNGLAIVAVQEMRARRWIEDGTLEKAVLTGANLRGAELEGANLREADLRSAVLEGCSLDGACLDGADLGNAVLKDAKLVGATLRGANLYEADITLANLSWADLQGTLCLTEQQLSTAQILWAATMEDGNIYDGHLHLSGDKAEAHRWGINYENPIEREQFYCAEGFTYGESDDSSATTNEI